MKTFVIATCVGIVSFLAGAIIVAVVALDKIRELERRGRDDVH